MIKSDLRKIGDNKVIGYQRFILIIGILLILIFSIVSFVNWNLSYFMATVIIALFFAGLLTAYSRVYTIEYDKAGFFLSNMFSRHEKNTKDFIEIRQTIAIPFLYAISFNDGRFFFLITSNEYYRNLFKSKKKYAVELTELIKEYISDRE